MLSSRSECLVAYSKFRSGTGRTHQSNRSISSLYLESALHLLWLGLNYTLISYWMPWFPFLIILKRRCFLFSRNLIMSSYWSKYNSYEVSTFHDVVLCHLITIIAYFDGLLDRLPSSRSICLIATSKFRSGLGRTRQSNRSISPLPYPDFLQNIMDFYLDVFQMI